MKRKDSLVRMLVLTGMIMNLLVGPVVYPGSVVHAQSPAQEVLPVDPAAGEPTQTPTEIPTPLPTDIPVEIPTEIPVEIPTETPVEIPTELPTDIPTALPTDLPPEIIETPTPTSTVDITPTLDTFTPTPSLSPSPTPTLTPTPNTNLFAIIEELLGPDGSSLEEISIIGPPNPPPGFEAERKVVDLSGEFSSLETTRLSVPAYRWVFGCSAVSAAMIAAYYDNHGFPNIYTGPTNSGVMPLTDTGWSSWSDGSNTYPNNPLIASHNGIDGRTSRGSIDDYWIQYGSSTSDPFLTNGWTQHSFGASVGDYMRTSQSAYSNTDGSTHFWNYGGSAPLSCDYMAAYGYSDGTLGRKLFYQAKGYTVTDCYNQRTDNQASGGFSFNQFKAEIQAGRPVLINLLGHSIVGTGYDDASQTVYINDTWDNSPHSMTWGGYYSGMLMHSVSIVNLENSTPGTPVLISPAANEATNTIRPVFSWNPASNASSYKIQISLDSTFTDVPSIVVDATTAETSFTPEIDLSTNGAWYWRVAGISSTDVYGSWSTIQSFIIDTEPPTDVPVLSSPQDNATPLGIPIFTWAAPADANAYQFEYDNNSDFLSPEFTSDTISSTSYKPTGMPAGTRFYWHVKARDAAGNWGTEWSTSRSLVVQDSLPTAPVLISPAAGLMTNIRPTLQWNPVDTGNTYEVQIASSTSFAGTIVEDVTKDPGILTHTVETPLTDGTWYWRVRSTNNTGGTGDWSASRSFIMDTLPPGAPVLSSPAINAIVRNTPAFSWTVPATAKSYIFEYGTTLDGTIGTFTPVHTSVALSTASYTPPAMSLGGYYWHVQSSDAAGNWSAWSDLRKINIYAPVLAPPSTLTPATGISFNDPAYTFSWQNVAGAKSFVIQFADTSNFSAADVDTKTINLPVGELSYTIADPVVLHDGVWFWHVATVNASDEIGTAWSTTRTFTFDTTPPLSPALYLPAKDALVRTSTSQFYWVPPATAAAYQMEYGTVAGDVFTSVFLSPVLSVYAYTPPAMGLGTFFWHVKSRDAAGNWSDWGELRKIEVKAPILAAPTSMAPAAGIQVNTPAQTFSWVNVSGAKSYNIQFADTATFVSSDPDTQLVTLADGVLTYTIADPVVLHTGTWYWRVATVNATGEIGAWSASYTLIYDTTPPLAPVLYLPAKDALVRTPTSLFYWSPAVTATAYQMEYGTVAGDVFTSVYLSPVLSAYTYTPPAMGLGTFFWHVKSRDTAGNWSDWGELRKIDVKAPFLAAPTTMTPAAGIQVNTPAQTFTWVNVTGAKSYNIQFADTATFVSSDPDTQLVTLADGVLTYTIADPVVLHTGTWYWRVATVNATGEIGAWSAARTLIYDTTPPLAPVLYQPVKDALVRTPTSLFYWSAAATATAYQMEYGTVAGDVFTSVYLSPVLSTYSYTPPVMSLGTFFWHVKSRDAAGNWSDWGELRKIDVKAPFLAAPTTMTPAAGIQVNNPAQTFTWVNVTGAKSYNIQFADTYNFAPTDPDTQLVTLADGILTYTIAAPVVLHDGLWYWRLASVNATGEIGAWSAARTFTLDATAPIKPDLLAPAATASMNSLPTFTWSIAATATAYQFQYDDNIDFSSPTFTTPGDTVPGTPQTVASFKPVSMSLMKTYYWHVRARDAAGNWSAWSSSREITILDTDTDGDNLPDVWETSGYDADGDFVIDVNLPALGASKLHKDIFVEMDYMVKPGTGDLGPNTTVINYIMSVFNNAPVSNPDGTTGIHIHLQKDQQVPYDADLNPVWTEFDAIKSSYFDAKRTATHHYMIWANGYGGSSSSGISRGINASDFIVSLGLWNNGSGGTTFEKLGTFIHELGHNLNLTHGGSDHENYKPNYLSVMNYFYQVWGLWKNGVWGDYGYPLLFDYQRMSIVDLNESSLNESTGLSGADNLAGYGALWVCNGYLCGDSNALAIDWDDDGYITSGTSADINGSGTYGYLISQNNWQNISFKGGGVIGSSASLSELQQMIQVSPPPIEELTWEMQNELKQKVSSSSAFIRR